jgi:hypothetical protein
MDQQERSVVSAVILGKDRSMNRPSGWFIGWFGIVSHLLAWGVFVAWLGRTDWLFGHFQGPSTDLVTALTFEILGMVSTLLWVLFHPEKSVGRSVMSFFCVLLASVTGPMVFCSAAQIASLLSRGRWWQ